MHTDLIEKAIARRLRVLADESGERPYDWAEFKRRGAARRIGSRPDGLRTGASLVGPSLVGSRHFGRNQHAALATAAAVLVLAITVVMVRWDRRHIPPVAPAPVAARATNHGTHVPGSPEVAEIPGASRNQGFIAAAPDQGSHAIALDRGSSDGGGSTKQSATEPVTAPGRLMRTRTRAIEGWLADLPRDPGVVRVGAHVAVSSLQDQIAALDDLMSAAQVTGADQGRLDALELRRAQLVNSLAQVRYAELLASANP